MTEATTKPAAVAAGDGAAAGAGAGREAAVRLRGVRKSYGSFDAIAGVDVEIARGEFFTMLGPSGSGKTTLLRMIAGFVPRCAGTVELHGVDVTREPPSRAASTPSSRTTRCSHT